MLNSNPSRVVAYRRHSDAAEADKAWTSPARTLSTFRSMSKSADFVRVYPGAGVSLMKQQPILSRREWIVQCCTRLQELDPSIRPERCHQLAATMWDRGECQVMNPAEAAAFVFDERVHSGFRDDI